METRDYLETWRLCPQQRKGVGGGALVVALLEILSSGIESAAVSLMEGDYSRHVCAELDGRSSDQEPVRLARPRKLLPMRNGASCPRHFRCHSDSTFQICYTKASHIARYVVLTWTDFVLVHGRSSACGSGAPVNMNELPTFQNLSLLKLICWKISHSMGNCCCLYRSVSRCNASKVTACVVFLRYWRACLLLSSSCDV